MKRLIHIVATILALAGGVAIAADLPTFEYWFDNDYASKTSGELSDRKFSENIPVASLDRGVHSFNFRVQDTTGNWGAIYNRQFLVHVIDADATGYEYWFDNDYSTVVGGNVSSKDIKFAIDLGSTSLTPGLHTFSFRFCNGAGEWGAPYNRMVVTTGEHSGACAYEYWLDNDYSKKVEGAMTGGATAFTVDMKDAAKGLHSLSFRARNNLGQWGAIKTTEFYITPTISKTDAYEYWIDGDLENRVGGAYTGPNMTFAINMGDRDKKGFHSFTIRYRNADGEWGAPYHQLFSFFESPDKAPMVGYRHWINGKDLGYVAFETRDTVRKAFNIQLPKDLGLDRSKRTYTFTDNSVTSSVSDSLHCIIQLETEAGWSAPTRWDLPISETHTASVADMAIPSYVRLQKPTETTFHAVRFAADGSPLYVRSTQEASFEIYKDGARVDSIPGATLKAMKQLELAAGSYYGILHTAPVNEANPSDSLVFHLLNTPNKLMAPEITFAEGFVTIDSKRSDAVVYYTIDGTDPTAAAGIRYADKFALDHNATVKAFATLPGFDIEDSEIASLDVDSYKLPTPSISFGNLQFSISKNTDLAGVSVRYTLDGTEPTAESTLYENPFTLKENATVSARSFKDGYNPSDSVRYVYVYLDHVVKTPKINVDGTAVSIESQQEGASLFYNIGNSNPAEMKPYTDSFTMDWNGMIYAQARMAEYFDSDVAEYEMNGNKLGKPVITHADDKLTISHARSDVDIYYTFDESKATTTEDIRANGTKHTPGASIPFRHNGFVAAFATYPGDDKDIEDSEIETKTIDTYVVDNPAIAYYNRTVVITPSTEEGVTTRYTDDGSEPTEQSPLYENPLSFSQNKTVKARSFKEGWTPSGIVSFDYIHANYVVKNPVISVSGSTFTIARGEGDTESTLYYSIGNSDPDQMQPYESSFDVDWNTTVYAQARRDGFFPSEVVEYNVNGNQLPKPVITHADDKLTITHARSDVDIYYTFDEAKADSKDAIKAEGLKWTTGTSIDFRHNGFVAAFATYPGDDKNIEDSEIETLPITDYKVDDPTIAYFNRTVVITPSTEDGVTTHFTIDGSDPTEESDVYTAPLTFTEDVTIKARSFKEGWTPSEIVPFVYVYADYQVEKPVINVDGIIVTITKTDEDSELFYSIDNHDPEAMQPYTAPFEMDHNGNVYAQARKAGFFDSDIASMGFGNLVCKKPEIKYDGRYARIESTDEFASLYYTTDSEDMSAAVEIKAGEPFDIEGLHTIRAVARRDGYQDSDTEKKEISYYADEDHAIVKTAGNLSDAFGWTSADSESISEAFSVEGPIGETDYTFLRTLSAVRHLDLLNVSSASVPDNAFANTALVSIILPAATTAYGNGIFADCNALCAITLNSGASLPAEALDGFDNPNLLCYLSGAYQEANGAAVPDVIRNVVIKGETNRASDLKLTDGYPFCCPESFTAESASYMREFTKKTELGGSQGWETIALPFEVGEIYHGDRTLVPFAVYDETSDAKPFWLYKPDGGSWARAASIEANMPYLISMPNCDAYGDDFCITGEVFFTAKNADVQSTPEAEGWQYNASCKIWPNFSHIPASKELFVVNDKWLGDSAPGSIFRKGEHDVRPFECFVTSDSSRNYLSIFDHSDIEMTDDFTYRIWAEGNEILISVPYRSTLRIFDLNGQLVRIVRTVPGVVTRVSGLTKGIYFVGHQKVLLTQ